MNQHTDRPLSALLIIDMQNDVVREAWHRDAVVANIASLVEAARAQSVQVVWVQHSGEGLAEGSEGWRYIPELVRSGTEALVPKNYGDAFEGTELESVLQDGSVGHLIVVGAETDACIRSTIHGAFARGYDVTLVSDAHTAGDKTAWGAPRVEEVVAHTNLYWSFQAAPDRVANVLSASEVNFVKGEGP